ncbi:MAG: YtxH domain-containing protein [Candidatus Limnocylindria bacterium]
MPTGPAATADDITESIRSFIDRVTDANVTREMAKRGQTVAGLLAERGAEVGDRATDAWRETRPLRQDAADAVVRAGGEAARWSDRTWRSSVRPMVRDLWKRRTLAMGAAGAALPVGKELVDTAAARLGLRERTERRHWGMFFGGLILGAIGGAIAAMLFTPKRGSEIRREIGSRADGVRDEIASRAKEADWMPIFQRENGSNGAETTASVTEAAADTGHAAESSTPDRAEPISEAPDSVDRETSA